MKESSSLIPPVPSPRVKESSSLSPPTPSPRVKEQNKTPTSTLLTRSKLPKNCRYNNALQHKYALCYFSRNSGTNFKGLAADNLLAQHIFQQQTSPMINHIFKEDGTKETLESLLAGPDKDVWNTALSNEWGRLAQGNKHGIKFSDTIEFVAAHNIPLNK